MSPFKIILSFVILSLLGFISSPWLSIDLLPSKSLPVLTISFMLNDAPPEVVEQEATAPLENALSQLTQLKKIYSISGYETGTIELTFDRTADIAFKKFEANSIIRHMHGKLNAEVSYPLVEQQAREDKSKSPLLVYRINARLAPYQIRKTAEDILYATLAQQEGVNEVAIRGAEEIQLSIAYDYELMQQLGISVQDIATQIKTEFSTFYPGAMITAGSQRFTIKGGDSPKDLGEVENVMIRTSTGEFVPLKKIARVYWEESKPRQFFRINGLNSITLTLYADEGINRLKLAKNIKSQINSLQAKLPQGYGIIQDYDDTEFLRKEIDKNIYRSLLSFFILSIFLIISYRSIRHLTILFSGILISLGLTSLASFFLGIHIHLYTIAGVTISLGIIIDNSIVVLDHLRTKGNKKIVLAVLGAALTTIMALMLVLFLPEEERQNLTEFCIIVSVAIACSVVTAIFYTPAVNSLFKSTNTLQTVPLRLMRKKIRWFLRYAILVAFITRYRKSFIALCILAFGVPVFLLPAKWEGHEFYNKTIGSIVYQETIRPITDKALGGALRIFVRNVYERSGYREAQRTQLYVRAELPQGNTLEDMNHVMHGIESYLATIDGLEKYITQIYSGQHASISITFDKKYENASLPYILKSRLIARSLDWGGVKWNIYGVGQGFSNTSGESIPSFNVEMKGYNYGALAEYSEVMARKLMAHKRIQKVNTNERLSWDEKNTEQLILNFAASSGGGSSYQLTSQLFARAGNDAPSLYLTVKEQQYPVYIKPFKNNRISTHELMETSLITSDSHRVKLTSLAAIRKEVTTNAIHKEDRQYIRLVGFEYYGSYKFGNEYLDQVLNDMQSEMPPGYSVKKITYSWNWGKAKRQYGLVLILAIGIYFITTILFENIKQPIYIVLTIPLSFIGLFLMFGCFDFYFDQGGYAAFILLGGLVVNATIYIVNDFNNLRKKNYNRSVMKAVTGKMKPIILTIASTCLGLLPFIIGGQSEVFWFALAIGTIGGLMFSLLVVFLFLPIILTNRSQLVEKI